MTVARRPSPTAARPARTINKAELARTAVKVRAEVGLDEYARFDPYVLAELYGIDIYPLDVLTAGGCPPESLRFFGEVCPGAWSAALVPDGTGMFIIENTAHLLERRRSNVAHEMAHVVLEHLFTQVLLGGDAANAGCVNAGDRRQEDEAAELGAELLLPKNAALRAARERRTDEQVAQQYDVSTQLAAWRMNATGARKRVAAATAKWGNSGSVWQ